MSFLTSRDGTLASARAIASPDGIPFMYNSGDNTTVPSNETKITASDAAASDEFGYAVAVGSGRVVVGARYDDDAGNASGSAYIFDLEGNQIAKITASDAADGDQFGTSVAAGSGKIVVGAYGNDDAGGASGSAYIYDLSGTQLAKITASDAAAGDVFGFAVAVGSGRIVVGARGDDDNGSASGSAYIFDLNGNEITKITASDGAASDVFGYSVAVGSGRIVVGATDDGGSGSAYIFDLNGNEITKITASDIAAGDDFGWSVAVGCGRIVVGAKWDDDGGSNSGSAYIFDLEGTQLAKITASDAPAANDLYGNSVAVGNGRIVVGVPFDDDVPSSSGSAYIYDLSGTQLAKITTSDAADGDTFGFGVAVGCGRVVVGAHLSDDTGSSSGSAYIFDTPNVITPYDVRDWEYG